MTLAEIGARLRRCRQRERLEASIMAGVQPEDTAFRPISFSLMRHSSSFPAALIPPGKPRFAESTQHIRHLVPGKPKGSSHFL